MPSDDENDIMGPQQDPGIRRQIRQRYRNIQEEINENRHDLQHPSNEGLVKTLDQVEDVFKSVKMTREAALDSSIVAQISHMGMKQAEALHTDFNVFDPTDFCQKIVQFMSVNRDNVVKSPDGQTVLNSRGWVSLGQAVQPFLRRSPAIHFMYGAFNKDPPSKKVRQKRIPEQKRDANAAVKRPERLEPTQIQEREKTTEEVASILNILQKECPEGEALCFFEFVVNPESFGQTIENMFYTSFLIRDGHARIDLDEDGLPAIQPLNRRGKDGAVGGGPDPADKERNQVVMSINMSEWKDIIETFNIREPVIPTRPT